jgi:RND family efflux transporter MFP subunit
MHKYGLQLFLVVALLPVSYTSTAKDEGNGNSFDSGDSHMEKGKVEEDNGDWTTRHCLLEAHMVVDLSSPVVGVIAKVNVGRGDKVRKGEVVVQLRSEVEQAMVNLSRAQVKFGEITALRNKELFEQELISEQEKDEVELKSELSRLELVAAQKRLQQKIITSPISGIILERLMDPGEYVGEYPILKIASLDPLYVEAVLPMELYGTIKVKTIAEVALEQPIGGLYKAEVTVVDQGIDAASGTFGVRLTLPNPKNTIPTGLKCKIRFSSQ